MRSGKKVQRALRKFADGWRDFSGSERSAAQTYLNELISCYGADRRAVGARFEDSHTAHGIVDLYWPGVCVVEMEAPSEAGKPPDHHEQALEYWRSSDDSRFVVLCAFQRFEVWEREHSTLGLRAKFPLAELPDNYEKLSFLAGTDQASRNSLFLKLAAVVVALGVWAFGILLLWGVWNGRPAAAAFSRVGGATRVETSLEASRFWLTPPQYVVETQTDASQLMLRAAQCAVVHDAPLLFTSPDPKRQRLVDARINDWRKIEPPTGIARLKVITIQTPGQAKNCLRNRKQAGIAGISTLEVPNPLIRLPRMVPPRQTLAHVVVFAAAIEPGDPPDVAVGVALAAHMARANREQVSLVVVPHYLESDLELEKKLQSQHELVTGGVVLGQTQAVPEDTRELLRQLLTSRDRQGVIAQLQDNLGSAGSLIAALLALVGLGTAARIAAPIGIELLERNEKIKRVERRLERINSDIDKKATPGSSAPGGEGMETGAQPAGGTNPVPPAESDWLIALGGNREVIVWLRSGLRVTGTIESQIPANTQDATVFRIKNASLIPEGQDVPQKGSSPGPEGKYVLVSVKDIELIENQ